MIQFQLCLTWRPVDDMYFLKKPNSISIVEVKP